MKCLHCGQDIVITRAQHLKRVAEARRRYAAGEKAVALAHEFGVDASSVYRWIATVPKRQPKISPNI